MKYFLRIVVANMMAGAIVSFFINHTIAFRPATMTFSDWIFAIWAVFTMLSMLFWLISMFYFWGITQFQKKSYKTIWFFVILIGILFWFLGPLVFYIVVYELKKGVRESVTA